MKNFLNLSKHSRSIILKSVIVCLACMLLAACGKKEEAAAPVAISVKAMKVARGDVPIMKEAVGQLKGAVDAEIRARVEGVVTSMSFQEGKEVTEGQLLYTIDPAPYEAKVAEANGKLAEATTRLAEAESDLKRVRPLVEMKALSARDLDAAVANEGAARGAVDAAKASVEAAQIELGYCKITAPVSGTIGLTKAKVGEFVGRPPNPVVLNTVSQLDPIHVRFALSEQDYLYFTGLKQKEIASGAQPVARKLELILADGSLYPEKGEVISMAREIDPQTGSFALEAAFPNPHKLLRPGQYGKIRGVAETLSAVLVIPKRAIRELQGQNQVFVVKGDKTVEARTITLGAQVGELQAVQSGLNEGEIIVVDGIQRLKSGMPVAPEIQESNSPAESEK